MNTPFTGPDGPLARATNTLAWSIGPAFGLLAAWFLMSPTRAPIPIPTQPLVDRARFAPGARRRPMTEPPSIVVGGFSHACNECHRLFDSPPVEHRVLTQHTNIAFNHGMNNRCFNCHDRKNRERLVLHDGSLVTFNEVSRLCSQCHGTVYRDWQMGTHGKTMGSWDVHTTGVYAQHRLNCNDCHDPHSPAYKPIQPLPGPDTLRMGDQSPHEESERHHTPLRHWSMPRSEHERAPGGPLPGDDHQGSPAPIDQTVPPADTKEHRP
jgi:hypothetical protein